MKVFVKALIIGLFASAAHASVSLDTRLDWEGNTPNDNSATPAYGIFKSDHMRLKMKGDAGKTSFTARLDILKTGTDLAWIDYLYATRSVNSNWNVSMGVIETGIGGVEAANNPADIYLGSAAYGENTAVYHQPGVQFAGTMGKNSLKINVTNQPNGASTTSHMTGLVWDGDMGSIKPHVGYHMSNFGDTKNAYMSVGLKWMGGNGELEFDYHNNTYDPAAGPTAALTPGGGHSGLTSMVALYRHKMGSNSIHFKYDMSTAKFDAADDNTGTGMTLAYEAQAGSEMRWHAAVTQQDITIGTGNVATDQKVIVGMRLLGDFAK